MRARDRVCRRSRGPEKVWWGDIHNIHNKHIYCVGMEGSGAVALTSQGGFSVTGSEVQRSTDIH